jgi:aspartyl-tRNA(Asn)/glutamyl-tRNA(Gln) amidotransferase subunit A
MSSTVTVTPPLVAEAMDALHASRARPLEPSPTRAASEPAHADSLLRACAAGAPVVLPPVVRPEAGALHELTVGGLLERYASGTATPLDVFDALSSRWGSDGPAPGAVLRTVPGAREHAEQSARRWVEGTARPLEGVPFGVKDIIDVDGAVVTCGSAQLGDRLAPSDATVVARLRQAGAIPVVMTATSEFAAGAAHNGRFGPVRNPWDRSRWTGGSSTGSGAAVAARLLPFALGTDTGGSIRVPSAFCGVSGIKPTYGLVPRTGVATLSWSLDHVGPLARTAADLARVLAVIAGPDGMDPTALPHFAAPGEDLAPARVAVGVVGGWYADFCDVAVMNRVAAIADVLRDSGAALKPFEVADADFLHQEAWTVFYSEMAATQEARLQRRAFFDEGTNARLEAGLVPSAVDYLRALRRRPLAQRALLEAMEVAGVHVLLMPTVGATAPRLDDETLSINGMPAPMARIIPRHTRVWDYLGFPAVSIPAGSASDGLPTAVQLVGVPGADALVLRLAQTIQARTDHHRSAPPEMRAE